MSIPTMGENVLEQLAGCVEVAIKDEVAVLLKSMTEKAVEESREAMSKALEAKVAEVAVRIAGKIDVHCNEGVIMIRLDKRSLEVNL